MSQGEDLSRLSVATSPHIREEEDISAIMWWVVAALTPAALFGVWNFGWYAAAVVVVAVVSAAVAEALWQRICGTAVMISDGSAVVTGLLVGLVLPPSVPLYVPMVASGVGVLIGKQLFGGLGCNIWNPALVGRAFVQIAYPQHVTLSVWPVLRGSSLSRVLQDVRHAGDGSAAHEVVLGATPLAEQAVGSLAATDGVAEAMYPSVWALFLGNIPGSIGETSALLLLIGGLFLIWKGYINWKVPAVFLGTLFLFAAFVPTWKIPTGEDIVAPSWWFFGMYQIFAGGAVIGAFFMATDMVTTPITSSGQVIFALGCALITALIRLVGHGFPEGVAYSILLMNTATPVIDRYTRPRTYGTVKK